MLVGSMHELGSARLSSRRARTREHARGMGGGRFLAQTDNRSAAVTLKAFGVSLSIDHVISICDQASVTRLYGWTRRGRRWLEQGW